MPANLSGKETEECNEALPCVHSFFVCLGREFVYKVHQKG